MSRRGPQGVWKPKTRFVGKKSHDTFQSWKNFFQNFKNKFKQDKVTFNRKPKNLYDRNVDVQMLIYNWEAPLYQRLILTLLTWYIIGYYSATILYDYHTRYIMYVKYPNHMRLLDMGTDYVLYWYYQFLKHMPFDGDIPDLSKPENFNKFKRELYNRAFLTEYKEKQRKEVQRQIDEESKLYKDTMKGFEDFLNQQDKKISQLRPDEKPEEVRRSRLKDL